MKHILSVLVNNSSGVLSHVASLFTRRGYNIESLCVAETHQNERSIITLVVDEDDKMVSQIERQLYKLVDVIKIEDLTDHPSIERELVLATIQLERSKREEILSLVDVFQARIVDMSGMAIMIELIAEPRKIRSFIKIIAEYGIIKIARSGSIALPCFSADE
ncbi:MAG: acetolactate synthase small subunit [Spirochaetia bacterium]|nr:acetolactate synthase small subunit [Spirochaetia bacterium]